MLAAGCVGRSVVQEKEMSLPGAAVMVERAGKESEIPITLNREVLEKINQYAGTARGRSFFNEARARMPAYQKLISEKTKQYGVPPELIAIPFWESGFKNDLVSGARATGIWQFIPSTARHYHLTVNDTVDERLDVAKETDAAMRYLKDLNDLFHDWRLAIKAYNEGENHVQELITKNGTRDPWVLERKDPKEGYLTGTMAMMIMLKNPELMN
jgi:membrane-bound lytic murein transglycosylase D